MAETKQFQICLKTVSETATSTNRGRHMPHVAPKAPPPMAVSIDLS